MVELTPKDVLASISHLGGASADEVAADLAVSKTELMPTIVDLATRGYIRPLRRVAAVAPAGVPHFDPEELADETFDLTFRGFVELRS